MAIAAKASDEACGKVIYRAAQRGVTVSVVVREGLEHASNAGSGNR